MSLWPWEHKQAQTKTVAGVEPPHLAGSASPRTIALCTIANWEITDPQNMDALNMKAVAWSALYPEISNQ